MTDLLVFALELAKVHPFDGFENAENLLELYINLCQVFPAIIEKNLLSCEFEAISMFGSPDKEVSVCIEAFDVDGGVEKGFYLVSF